MADNVVTFPGVAPRKEGRNEEVIALLDRLRAEAEAGNIASIGCAVVTNSKEVLTSFWRYADASVFTLIGAASCLHARLVKEIDDLD